MNDELYLAMDIGCIECGEKSKVIGVYTTKAEANKAIKDYIDPNHRWGRKGRIGQHYEEVFKITIPVIREDNKVT